MEKIRNMRLGELIDALEKQPQDNRVSFPFGRPRSLVSYRGFYEQLAITADRGEGEVGFATVGGMLAELKAARSGETTFIGWKGGEYHMHRHTPIWIVDSAGHTSQAAISGVVSDGGETFLLIGWCSWEGS